MNRAIITGSVIVGITVMMSLATVGSAYAVEPDYSCSLNFHLLVVNLKCEQSVTANDHVLVHGFIARGVCHYDVSDFGFLWRFNPNPPEVGNDCFTFEVLKANVTPQ